MKQVHLAITPIVLTLILATLAVAQEDEHPPEGKVGTKVPDEVIKQLTQPYSSSELQAIKQRSSDAWNVVQPLSSPPPLPSFPLPTGGARFLRGLSYPKMLGGPMYILSYACPAGAPEMMRWYAEALKRYAWDIDKASSNNISITARHEHDTCSLTFYNMNRKTYKSTLDIKYQQTKP